MYVKKRKLRLFRWELSAIMLDPRININSQDSTLPIPTTPTLQKTLSCDMKIDLLLIRRYRVITIPNRSIISPPRLPTYSNHKFPGNSKIYHEENICTRCCVLQQHWALKLGDSTTTMNIAYFGFLSWESGKFGLACFYSWPPIICTPPSVSQHLNSTRIH